VGGAVDTGVGAREGKSRLEWKSQMTYVSARGLNRGMLAPVRVTFARIGW